MKKTLALLAAVLFLSSLYTPKMNADAMPSPSCGSGFCKPVSGGGH